VQSLRKQESDVLQTATLGIALPALVAGSWWVISWQLWRRANTVPVTGQWGGPLAVATGYAAGHCLLDGFPAYPPVSIQQALFYLALGLAAFALFEPFWGRKGRHRCFTRVVVCAIFALGILRTPVRDTWTAWEGRIGISALVAAAVLLWAATEALALRRPGTAVPLSLWFATACASVCMALAGSAFLGQLTGALAATLGAAAVLAWWAPRVSLAQGGVTLWVPLYSGLMYQAHFHSGLPLLAAICLYAAPLAPWLLEGIDTVRWTPWKVVGARVACLAVPVALALAQSIFAAS
jgi:hypothetical protein